MQEERESYDQSITIYSPDGRMYQVEYAREAVKKGSISVGMVYNDGIILMVEKRIPSKLVMPESVEKIFKISDMMGCSTSGLIADARILVDYSREVQGDYKVRYNEEMPVFELVKRVSNIKRIYTQYGGIRPFGVSFLMGGIDDNGLSLFETDPSGAYKQYRAGVIGEGKVEVEKIIEKKYKDNMNLNKAVLLAFEAISKGLKKDINKMDIEIITISKNDGFERIPESKVKELKKGFKKKK